MRTVLLAAVLMAPAAICAAASFYLTVHGIDGWGWFLFAAMLTGSVRIRSDSI